MPASLDDILTAIKNGVVAINGINNTFANYWKFTRGQLLARKAMTTSVETLYTVPTGYQVNISEIDIANTSAGALTFTVYLVPSGGTAVAANALLSTISVAANSAYQWKGSQVLNSGDSIQSLASATTMTIMVTGNLSS